MRRLFKPRVLLPAVLVSLLVLLLLAGQEWRMCIRPSLERPATVFHLVTGLAFHGFRAGFPKGRVAPLVLRTARGF